jgi:hypothetical protein
MNTPFDPFQLFGPFFNEIHLLDNLFEPGYIIPVQLNKTCTHDKKRRCIDCGASAFLKHIYYLN